MNAKSEFDKITKKICAEIESDKNETKSKNIIQEYVPDY
jgi:hypothetical protein